MTENIDLSKISGYAPEDRYLATRYSQGARTVYACCTHAVLSHPAVERIIASPIEELITTDTIPPRAEVQACAKIKVLSVARLLGEAVKRIHHGDSISSLFI